MKFRLHSFISLEFNLREFGNRLAVLPAIAIFLYLGACSIPNLEDSECSEARIQVRKLYSFHIGNDMAPTFENLELRKEYLTPELFAELQQLPAGDFDYFSQTSDYPKAFRVGECKTIDAGFSTELQVLLFWKDDVRSEQREIYVEVLKRDEKWLVNKIRSNK